MEEFHIWTSLHWLLVMGVRANIPEYWQGKWHHFYCSYCQIVDKMILNNSME